MTEPSDEQASKPPTESMDSVDPGSIAFGKPAVEPQNILVAIDSSAAAERLLDMAGRMGRAMPEATLHVLHVVRSNKWERSRAGAPASDQTDAIEDAKEHLAYCARTLRGRTRIPVVQHFAVGDVASEILRRAFELDIDLLIIGTHDYQGFERFLLGSVAEGLMRKAGCPVLVVRPKHHKP
ncbi:MAG TPA: universal stress protein [Polyangiaceae bacterium]|nr:universal stress protein [Polyangiaceae bacterium]